MTTAGPFIALILAYLLGLITGWITSDDSERRQIADLTFERDGLRERCRQDDEHRQAVRQLATYAVADDGDAVAVDRIAMAAIAEANAAKRADAACSV